MREAYRGDESVDALSYLYSISFIRSPGSGAKVAIRTNPLMCVPLTTETLNAGAIAGIAVASVLVFVFLLISVALCVVIFVLARRQKKTHPELTWPGSTAQGIRVFIKVSKHMVLWSDIKDCCISSPQSFDPSKWLGYLAADSPEGEELDKFVAGWEDNDVEVWK